MSATSSRAGFRGRAVAALLVTLLAAGCTSASADRDGSSVTELPRVPWEGGPGYWEKFPAAAGYGWSDPDFFPIGLWWGVFDSEKDVAWDSDHGINTYIVTNPDSPTAYELIKKHQMSWIGGALPGMPRSAPAWVGDFLDDEVDGRFSPAEGQDLLQELADGLPDHDKPRYANYTNQVISWMAQADAETYVNAYTDVVSVDMYWYTTVFCDQDPFHGGVFLDPVSEDNCRSASSYGKSVTALLERDSADGTLQPVWNFVEMVPIDGTYTMSPDEVKGAVMASLIAGARGILWFNAGFEGPCATGNAIRQPQIDDSYPCADNIAAVKEINALIKQLAPVLNTQSYEWDFGAGITTMLKVSGDHAYVFAMSADGPGEHSLVLPDGIGGESAEVVGEDREIEIADGEITDDFASESSFHVYRIAI